MTEKRLKVDEEFLPFMSKIKLTDGRLITPMELVDRYNIILKENEQLKQKVDFYKYFQKDARELAKENEQLKTELEFWKRQVKQCPMRSCKND